MRDGLLEGHAAQALVVRPEQADPEQGQRLVVLAGMPQGGGEPADQPADARAGGVLVGSRADARPRQSQVLLVPEILAADLAGLESGQVSVVLIGGRAHTRHRESPRKA